MKNSIIIIIYILFFQLSSNYVFSQSSNVTLSGYALDSISLENLPYVTIIIKSIEDQFIGGTSTNEKGEFEISLPSGTYLLHASFIGYEDIEQKIYLENNIIQNLSFIQVTSILETIIITENRTQVEQKIDRKIIHVGADLQSGGGDAMQVLDQLAEIQISAEGGVEMRGSSNVNILVNGKPSPLEPQDLLQQINASEIDKIEIITSPSARNRANGLSGILNIILKKNSIHGFVGSLNLSANTGNQYRSSISLSQKDTKINFNLGLNISDSKSITLIERARVSDLFGYLQKGSTVFDGTVKGLKSAVDFFINDHNEISVSASYRNNAHDITNNSVILEQNNQYGFNSANNHIHKSGVYNLNYRRIMEDKGHFLEIDLHFTNNINVLSADYHSEEFQQESILNYDTQISNFSIDYVRPIDNHDVKIESGILTTFKNVSNNQDISNTISGAENNLFKFDENSFAVYGLINKTWKLFQMQAGLRFETFKSKSELLVENEEIERSFSNFFPSIHFSYKIQETFDITLGYNRRISRPSLWNVNPFSNSTDRFFNREGNRKLVPEFSDNIDLQFSRQFTFFSLTPAIFYRKKTQLILPEYILQAGNIVLQTFVNGGDSDAYGIEWNASIFPWKIWRLQINGNYYKETIHTDIQQDFGFLNLNRNNWTVKNLFSPSAKLSLDLSWIYRGSSTRRYSESKNTSKFDMAIRWKTFSDRGNISLRLTDIFDTFEFHYTQYGLGFEEHSIRKSQSRILYIGLDYRFASGQKGKNRRKKKRNFNEPGAIE